jgi:hypothetical protein
MAGFDLTTWTFIGTWVLVIGTIALMWWQVHQSWILNSANAVMTLRERFSAPGMRQARRALAQCLIDHTHEDVANLEVAAFFELIGALTHRGVLEDDLVWEAFGSWVTTYYWGLRHPNDQIAQARTALRDPLLLHEFEWLNGRMLAIDLRRLGPIQTASLGRDEEVRLLLRREAEIDLAE